MTDWFRSWRGAPTDNKWLVIGRKAGVLPGVVSAVFWALCDHASQHEDRGTVGDFDVEVYAAFSGFEERDIAAVIAALEDKGVISEGRLSAWERRQPKREDDRSTERVRAFRERESAKQALPTDGNDVKRDETQRNAREEESRAEQSRTEETPPVAPRRARPADAGGGRSRPEQDQVVEVTTVDDAPSRGLAVVSTTPPGSAAPPNAAQQLVEAWAAAMSVTLRDLGDVGRRKQFGVAKRLAVDGMSPADVTAICGWLGTQDWRQGGIDMLTVEANRARWVAAGKPATTSPPIPPPRAGTPQRRDIGHSTEHLLAIARGEA